MKKQCDFSFLKDNFGLLSDNFNDWNDYLNAKVNIIRKNGLESVKMNYEGYSIYDIFSTKDDCTFDMIVLRPNVQPDAFIYVCHSRKEVSSCHGYPFIGKKLANKLGYTFKQYGYK